MKEVGAGLCALLVAVTLGVADEKDSERSPVPIDDLPVPLERTLPLGAEPLAEAWTATEAQVALGRRLFFDPILSRDGSRACASCHRPEFAFADNLAFSAGVDDQPTTFNSPSLFNKGLSRNLLWDGRAATLEDQVLMPIANSAELGLGVDEAVQELATDPSYVEDFDKAFEVPPDRDTLARALAAFVRALVVGDSPVDRFRAGDFNALEPDARAGLWIYEGRGRCWKCHNGPNFSDESFHNTGVGVEDGKPQAGRFKITAEPADRGKFRTPGLRMLTKTAPYMHDGSLASLQEVVEFYREGGRANANLSSDLAPLELSDQDVQNLVAFLKALSAE